MRSATVFPYNNSICPQEFTTYPFSFRKIYLQYLRSHIPPHRPRHAGRDDHASDDIRQMVHAREHARIPDEKSRSHEHDSQSLPAPQDQSRTGRGKKRVIRWKTVIGRMRKKRRDSRKYERARALKKGTPDLCDQIRERKRDHQGEKQLQTELLRSRVHENSR